MIKDKADLGSISIIPIAGVTNIEKTLAWSHFQKVRLFESLGTSSVYLCFGPARIFSKKLYQAMRYPKDCPPDAYSYLLAKQKGLRFVYIKEAEAIFRMPTTFADYRKQSVRFVGGNTRLAELFDPALVASEFRIPRLRTTSFLFKTVLGHPVLSFRYAVLLGLARINAHDKRFRGDWEPATTSKKLITESLNIQP
jgi:hypothetical protein